MEANQVAWVLGGKNNKIGIQWGTHYIILYTKYFQNRFAAWLTL